MQTQICFNLSIYEKERDSMQVQVQEVLPERDGHIAGSGCSEMKFETGARVLCLSSWDNLYRK